MTDTLSAATWPAVGRGAASVIGDGLLATVLARAFASVERGDEPAPVVWVSDTWDESITAGVLRTVAEGRPAIPVGTEPGFLTIGPYTRPGRAGCPQCVANRRERADESAPARAILRENVPELTVRRPGLLSGPAALAAATWVKDEIDRVECRGADPRLVMVRLSDLEASAHEFLPDPLCTGCGRLPDDSAADVLADAGAPQPKRAPVDYRIRDLDPDRLTERYVDSRTGLIRQVKRGVQGGLIVAGAILPLRGSRATEPGVGRSDRYASSRRIAILEALERWGGVEPGGRRVTVTGRRRDLDRALDVRRLGVHDDHDYARAGFGFRPFDEDATCRWIWAHSYQENQPILVPQTLGYYRHDIDGDLIDRPFVYDNSNGCAIGGTFEEAVLHGILEVLERDAFLLTWHCRLPAPRIDLEHADRDIRVQVAAVEASTGYRLTAFDITAEHGIPCVWAMASAPAARSADGAPLPAVVCAAGANPDARRAVLNAVNEVGPLLEDLIRRFPSQAAAAERMVDDDDLVRDMLDHSTCYGSPRAAGRLAFLGGQQHRSGQHHQALRTVEEIGRGGLDHADLRDDLEEITGRLLAQGSDVIVVNQTTPEHRAAGLYCVKVMVTGALSMTFGHRFRRTSGVERLLTAPRTLGYRERKLRLDELNLAPHPFP